MAPAEERELSERVLRYANLLIDTELKKTQHQTEIWKVVATTATATAATIVALLALLHYLHG